MGRAGAAHRSLPRAAIRETSFTASVKEVKGSPHKMFTLQTGVYCKQTALFLSLLYTALALRGVSGGKPSQN